MNWWVRPLVRVLAAVMLPLLVPALITGILWLLPGNPVDILCPPGICTGQQELAEHWNMDAGPQGFFTAWLGGAVQGDFGTSIRVLTGEEVSVMLARRVPETAKLVALAFFFVVLFSVAAVLGWIPRSLDGLWQGSGLIPAVILALFFAAIIQINYGAMSFDGMAGTLRLVLGAVVLAIADGTLSSAIVGTRSVFDEEMKQRYVGVGLLRGETALGNTMPNVSPALIGQLRGRVLHILSGTVVVEVVLGISGLGPLLFEGTLTQDFFVVLAAAWAFSLLSALLLITQALGEVSVEMYVRRAPKVVPA